jgi:hypothetical protein
MSTQVQLLPPGPFFDVTETDENVRDYLLEAEGKQRRRET